MLRARTRRELVREEIKELVWLLVGPKTCNNPPTGPRIEGLGEIDSSQTGRRSKRQQRQSTRRKKGRISHTSLWWPRTENRREQA